MQHIAIYSSPCSITYDPKTPMPKICKDCKHFIPPKSGTVLKMGSCSRLGELCLIDGNIEYKNVGYVREHFCKEKWFEEK